MWVHCKLSLLPIGCTPALSMTQKRRCSCSMWLVVLYKLYAFAFAFYGCFRVLAIRYVLICLLYCRPFFMASYITSYVEYLIPTYNILVLYWHWNLTKKSSLIGRFKLIYLFLLGGWRQHQSWLDSIRCWDRDLIWFVDNSVETYLHDHIVLHTLSSDYWYVAFT